MKFKVETGMMRQLKLAAGKKALLEYGDDILADAEHSVPVVSGDLQVSLELDDSDIADLKVYIGSDLPYASPVETGERNGEPWRLAGPANFLRDSLFRDR